jgi:4-aminobutyrate aminotransferase/(S)-3-amino-2-methylpropionate transaminase
MRAENLVGAAQRIEALLWPRLEALAAKHPTIADVRGRGAMLAVELVHPGGVQPDAARTGAVSKACHDAGLLTLTCGTYGNVLRFLPPLVIPEELLLRGADILEHAFATT